MTAQPLAAAPFARGLTRHLRACNTYDPARFRRFWVDGVAVGRVRDDMVPRLAARPDLIETTEAALRLRSEGGDSQARLDALCAHLAVEGGPRLRGERYALGVGALTIDRGMVSLFGTRAVGVHMNGYVRRPDGLHLWIGTRARDKPVAPGQLDNIVAGGQPAHLSIADNLAKEAAEEAAISADLIRQALPVGAIAYRMDTPLGLRDDVLYLYDLELPESFTPRNTDGEMERFDLTPVNEVLARVSDSDDVKFNVNLVLIDFCLRHGVIGPEHPDYLELALGLRVQRG